MIKELNLSNIHEGMIIKNYRELCRLLNLNITTGRSKILQIKEIQRYIDILKIENNNSYIVLEIYDKPIPYSVNSKYTKLIQDILLFYLSKENKSVVYINKSELIRILGLANNKYLEYKKDKNKLLYLADEYNIAEFYKRCDAKILSILEYSLKSLKKKILIDYSDAYKIYYLDNHGNYKYQIANIEQHQYILDVKKRILNKLNLKSEYQIYLNNDLKSIYYRLINKTVEEEMCWEGVFQCYKIIYNRNHIIKELNDERYRLNREVKRAIDIQAERKYTEENITLQKVLSEALIELDAEFTPNFKPLNDNQI